MAGDDDFAAYLAARWSPVVRTLVLLGAPRAEAERVALDALARCYGSWEHVRRADDVDAHVYRTVLERWRRAVRRGLPEADPAPSGDDPDLLLRRDLEADLARVTTEEREVLVLRFVAELDAGQVAEALDVPLELARDRESGALVKVDLDALRDRHR